MKEQETDEDQIHDTSTYIVFVNREQDHQIYVYFLEYRKNPRSANMNSENFVIFLLILTPIDHNQLGLFPEFLPTHLATEIFNKVTLIQSVSLKPVTKVKDQIV